MSHKLKYTLTILLLFTSFIVNAKEMITINIADYGAVPNDGINDNIAFENVSEFINNRGGNVKLIIPNGTYLIGRQRVETKNTYYMVGIHTLYLRDVENVEIVGNNATLKYDVGFRFGTFNTTTGLSNNSSWDCPSKTKNRIAGARATLGNAVYIIDSKNIIVNQLNLDGSFQSENLNNMNSFNVRCVSNKNPNFQADKINLGGSYGGCGINLQHYGVFILHSGNVTISNSIIKYFGTDGIQVANLHTDPNQYNVNIINCTIDYNARTGIALTGGNNISIQNSTITNTGNCVSFATGTGIDIEAQSDYKYKSKKVKNVYILNNYMAYNMSGEILTRFGMGSENVTIMGNTFVSKSRALNVSSTKNKNYTIQNNIIKGNKVVQIDGKQAKNKSDLNKINTSTIQFINNNFEN